MYNNIERVGFALFRKKHRGLRPGDVELLMSLEGVRKSLDYAHQAFDTATEDTLLDSASYEIMSLNKRYEYYLQKCKERSLIADML